MYADPFFTCTQFPESKKGNWDNIFPYVIKDYEVEKTELHNESTSSEHKSISIKNYPNPFSDYTIIEYSINQTELVTITIQDYNGRQLYFLKNKSVHEAGVYQIKPTGIDLPPGIYYCTIQTDSTKETKKILVVK
ncbi:MAG: T9SS type A sorting domain-containing protein [Chlorobi bacterium]|nr:T9SS type A sorting domain-containing protein [Chlorobiota bacterium]